MGAAEGGETPSFFELVGAGRTQLGSSRPLTVSLVAVLLVALGVIHAAGALGSLSLGLAQNGLGRAMVAGALALAIGVGETVCAVQVRRGRAWARFASACLAALMLLWLTMAPWSPGALTVVVFAAWLAVGALLVHPLTSRFFAAVQPAARQV
ncbi:MAG: hypothetical protein LBD97_06840 [Bifidobacteriaceae bacterium]|nr:hypothetical protein [Bifidobacteriaceae bacterium]